MSSRTVLVLAALALTPGALTPQGSAAQYQAACDDGDVVNCTVVGLIYESGAGGTRDLGRALAIYQSACGREVTAACRRMDLLESAGPRVTPDDELVRVGYVADAYDGAPLGGAIVRIRGIAGVGERRYLSDQAGRVVLDPLPRGRHPIEVRRGGYATTEGELPVPWETDFLILLEQTGEDDEVTVGRIYGQVTEEGSQAGISNVDITVLGSPTTRTISNGAGRFSLSGLEPGEVTLEFRRLGYESRTTTLTVEAGRTVEIYAAMSTRPVELPPVEVEVSSRYLERSGFYRRAQNVSGDRFTHRDIAQLNPMMVGDILRRVGGVTVVSNQVGSGSEATSNRRRAGDSSGRCRLLPYFNGTPTVSFDLEVVPPEEIEALEVYQGPNVPIEYVDRMQTAGATCGVILIWTRDPRRSR